MADFLIGFVSLAAKNDHVVLFRVRQRPFDGLHSVFDHHVRVRPLLHPGDDRVDDGHRVFRSGIVRGDDAEIGKFCADPSHNGPLEGVAVSAAAKDGDDPSLTKPAHGFEDIL